MTASTDRSTCYVLAEDAPYLRNLAVLWDVEPALAATIEAVDPADSYAVLPSKAGPPTVAVPGPSGRPIQLHSRYDPAAEAARLVEAIDTEKNGAFYVLGFGLGYHVEELFRRAGDEAIFFIFEADLRVLRTAFEHRDFADLLESRRITFFTQLDKAELLVRLTPHTPMLSIGTASVVHAPSRLANEVFYAQFHQWLDEFASFGRTSMNTLLLNSTRTAENIARNLGWYAAAPCLSRLRDRFAGRPAVIVSAGPSLRKNVHLLKEIEGKAIVIAVQTTLKPLLEMGIEPHFVTSLDYHDICTRFFENLPPTIRTELVAEPKAAASIFEVNPGPLTLLGSDYAEALLREMRLNKAALTPGATVAHLAYYLAEYLGADPIIFIGQDLGFSDGLCYAPGTSYEDVWRPELSRFCSVEMKQWEQIVRERFILRRIPDYQGRPMYTEERLFTYLQQFERDFLQSKRRIIDATEGGAAKRGATPMPFAEAIEQFCSEPFPVDLSDHGGLRWDRLRECVDCLTRRRDEAEQVGQVSAQTLPLLEEVRDHLDDQARVNRAISKIDALRARMNDLGGTYDLIAQLTQKSQLTRFKADRRIASTRIEGAERQRRQIARDLDNVRHVREAAEAFQGLMDDVIGALSARLGDAARNAKEAA